MPSACIKRDLHVFGAVNEQGGKQKLDWTGQEELRQMKQKEKSWQMVRDH